VEQSPEDLGLCPDISRLPSEVRCLIRNGNRDGCPSYSKAAGVVCTEMFKPGFGVDEVWMVLTDPANGISEVFFEEDGEQAEAWLERIICEACEAVNRSEHGDE
jgi:hypothetical protein